MITDFKTKKVDLVLALGAESSGNFSVFRNGKIYLSADFGDLLEEKKWKSFQKATLQYLHNNKIKPTIILSDFHPLFKTTLWGKELARKFNANFIQIQHHHAHIFSAIGDKIIRESTYQIPQIIYGIALDGTGLGIDDNIWGGEVFKIKKHQIKNIERIGQLENQFLLGGEIAIQEPARMLISILNKFKSKKEIYDLVKKYYSANEFELIYNQLQQNFNCISTSSTGRILDATSLLLGFCKNERKYKHEPVDLLEENSTLSYSDLKPKIIETKNESNKNYTLRTTHLFNYIIKHLHKKDKKRLAATAQLYIAQGLYKIIKSEAKNQNLKSIFASGGLTNNKIISDYFSSKNINTSKKIPRGDAGISFGQIVYYLLQ